MPGDPATIMFARFEGELNPAAIDALRAAFGITNDPLPIQYITYLKHLLSIRLSFRSLLNWFLDITFDREASRHNL